VQSLKFLIKVVNKTATSAAQLAKCILLHAYSRTTASFRVFGCKLRTIEAENP